MIGPDLNGAISTRHRTGQVFFLLALIFIDRHRVDQRGILHMFSSRFVRFSFSLDPPLRLSRRSVASVFFLCVDRLFFCCFAASSPTDERKQPVDLRRVSERDGLLIAWPSGGHSLAFVSRVVGRSVAAPCRRPLRRDLIGPSPYGFARFSGDSGAGAWPTSREPVLLGTEFNESSIGPRS